MQQLVDQGATIGTASLIVRHSYPGTRGDTFYRWVDPDDPEKVAVGVYGLWNALRGDQSPLGGSKVSDDARTIAQFWRLNGGKFHEIIRDVVEPDHAVAAVAYKTEAAMRAGDYFEPVRVEEDPMLEDRLAELHTNIARLDGIGEYLSSIPKPHFNG